MPMPYGWMKHDVTREWLEQMYVVEELSTTDLSKITGYSPSHVRRLLERFGIKKRTRTEGLQTEGSRLKRKDSMSGKLVGELNPAFIRGYWASAGHYYKSERGRCIPVHRQVAERLAGRQLDPDEVVHHINGNGMDNRPENLRIMTRSQHSTIHNNIRWHGKETGRECATD